MKIEGKRYCTLVLVLVSPIIDPLAEPLLSRKVQASIPEFVVPVRWCGVGDAPTMVEPDLSRSLRARNGEFDDGANLDDELGFDRRQTPVKTTDEVLRYRSGNPAVFRSFSHKGRNIVFRASIPSLAYEEGRFARSFPILHRGMWDRRSGEAFGEQMRDDCQDAWQRGDLLYYDADKSGFVNEGDFLLRYDKKDGVAAHQVRGQVDCSQPFGAPLIRLTRSRSRPEIRYGFADEDGSGSYDEWEPIYRFKEDLSSPSGLRRREVREQDLLLFPVGDPGPVLLRERLPDSAEAKIQSDHIRRRTRLIPFDESSQIKFVDRFLEPPGEFSIGFGALDFSGIYAVSMSDFELAESKGAVCRGLYTFDPSRTYVKRPSSGQFLGGGLAINPDFGLRVQPFAEFSEERKICPAQSIVVDDHAWIVRNERYEQFEGALVAHELAHALGLPHGDGLDNDHFDSGGLLSIDDGLEDYCNDTILGEDGRPKCVTSLEDPDGGHTGSVPRVGSFNRTDCFVFNRDVEEKKSYANSMQYCWNFRQNEYLEKERLEEDRGFQGDLRFNPVQFGAMGSYLALCGFGSAASMNLDKSLVDPARRSRSVHRRDRRGDTQSSKREWLDIGEYGYDYAVEKGSDQAMITFGVTLDQLRGRFEDDFKVYFGINADGKFSTGGAFDPIERTPLLSGEHRGHEFFVRATVSRDSRVDLSFLISNGKKFNPLRLPEVRARLRPVIIPSGMSDLPEEQRFKGHRLEISFPPGTFPLPFEPGATLEVIATDANGGIVDGATSRGVRSSLRPTFPDGQRVSTYPTCRIESRSEEVLQTLSRKARFVLRASGLTPGKKVMVEVNGSRVEGQRFGVVAGDGRVELKLRGGDVPVRAQDGAVSAVFSVSAGASTAICGLSFQEAFVGDEPPCRSIELPDAGSTGGYFPCGYSRACEWGEFRYFPAHAALCPDGSAPVKLPGSTDALDPESEMLRGQCLLPVDREGRPNCLNDVFNLPDWSSTTTPSLGFAYNFFLRTESGSLCNPQELESKGLELNLDPKLRELCLSDDDLDGVPNMLDPCPEDPGYYLEEWSDAGFEPINSCPSP